MTTSHTVILVEDDGSFEEFVWSCARALDFNIHMREEDSGTPIRLRQPSDYHLDELRKAELLLKEYESLTLEEAQRRANEQHARWLSQWEEDCVRVRAQRKKIAAAMAKVVTWVPPTPQHQCLKEYMIDQVDGEFRHISTDEQLAERKPAEPEDAESWRGRLVSRVKEDIRYHRQHHAESLERAKIANEWNAALAKSVTPVFRRR